MKLAILDADDTLFMGTLDWEVTKYRLKKGFIEQDDFETITTVLTQYKNGKIAREEVLEKLYPVLGKRYAGHSVKEVTQISNECFATIFDSVFHYVKPFLEILRSHDYAPVLLSGSELPIVEQLALHLRIEHYYGAEFESKDGVYTGKFGDSPAMPEDKVRYLERLITEQSWNVDWSQSLAIGDSISESLLFERVGIPLVYEPHKDVRKLAKQQRWLEVNRHTVLETLQNELTKIQERSLSEI